MDYVHLFNTHLVHDVQCRIKFFRGPRLDIVTGPYSVSLPSHRILPHIGGGVFPWKGAVGYLLQFWIYRGKVDWGGFYPLLAEIMVSFEPTQQPCALQLTTTLVVRAVDSMGRGTRVGIVGGLNPPPTSSCLQTLIFEWKSAKNFNPWAKFQTLRQLTPQFFEVNSNTAGDDMSPIFKLGEHDHECSQHLRSNISYLLRLYEIYLNSVNCTKFRQSIIKKNQ